MLLVATVCSHGGTRLIGTASLLPQTNESFIEEVRLGVRIGSAQIGKSCFLGHLGLFGLNPSAFDDSHTTSSVSRSYALAGSGLVCSRRGSLKRP